uniref:N-acetyltransferase 16 (putative) n=1 Tax=Pelodiscus sinensis TaxID=13735 RepID=K7GH22_PELSI|nr:probable N-acetyltransferase 16 [Pelodiscus sinensis]XP_025042554.1 probable N-acetyltransferase 16 [Pelodiscus sinensis]|eukprot:XP_006127329.1 probable N-acetyltransferase 16 [Pelodiscus sinensis]
MKLELGLSTDGQLQFVVATEKDFEEVVAMSKGIYGGLDYLPSRYHAWLHEPNRTVVLAKKNGEVIGLLSICVVDAGETVLAEGLRVAPWERGKGVAGVLQQFCTELVKKKHPSIKVLRLMRDDYLSPKVFQKYRLITTQGILLVRFNAAELLARLDAAVAQLQAGGFQPLPTEVLEPGEVRTLVLSPAFQSEVLPNSTLIQDWQPYKPSEANLALLEQRQLYWVVDCKARPMTASLCTQPFPIPLGKDWVYLNIDTFGHHPTHLKSQLLHHLRAHLPTLRGNVMCQLFLAPGLWGELAEFCQAGLQLELAKGYTEQYLLEVNI